MTSRARQLSADTSAAVQEAAEALRRGELVAFPTETVYGLGARADDERAVARIFEAKGRPAGNPLIVHAADAESAFRHAERVPDAAVRLAAAFWPGPLTLVLPRGTSGLAPAVTAGGDTVALRVPAHAVALALLQRAELPVAAPSANRSTSISPTRAEHVLRGLGDRIDVVLDGGPTGYGIESTIVDCTGPVLVLLRHGAIPAPSIAAHGALDDRTTDVTEAGQIARAPGSQLRHYAPNARIVVTPASRLAEEVRALARTGSRVGVIELSGAPDGGNPLEDHDPRLTERLPRDALAYGARLYASLHRLDDQECDVIVVAGVPEDAAWEAIRDRLRRASVR